MSDYKTKINYENSVFFTSKTYVRVSQSTDARPVLGLLGGRVQDFSPAQKAWQYPENCVQTRSFAYTSCLLFWGPFLCTRTPMVAHESPWMTKTCGWNFLFLLQMLECMCISCIDTAPNHIVSLTKFTLHCAFPEMYFLQVFFINCCQQPS